MSERVDMIHDSVKRLTEEIIQLRTQLAAERVARGEAEERCRIDAHMTGEWMDKCAVLGTENNRLAAQVADMREALESIIETCGNTPTWIWPESEIKEIARQALAQPKEDSSGE